MTHALGRCWLCFAETLIFQLAPGGVGFTGLKEGHVNPWPAEPHTQRRRSLKTYVGQQS